MDRHQNKLLHFEIVAMRWLWLHEHDCLDPIHQQYSHHEKERHAFYDQVQVCLPWKEEEVAVIALSFLMNDVTVLQSISQQQTKNDLLTQDYDAIMIALCCDRRDDVKLCLGSRTAHRYCRPVAGLMALWTRAAKGFQQYHYLIKVLI